MDDLQVLDAFASDIWGQDPLGELPSMPGPDTGLWFAVAYNPLEESEHALAAMKRVRALPMESLPGDFPTQIIGDLYYGTVTLPDWLDEWIPKLERAIEEKRAGRLPEVHL